MPGMSSPFSLRQLQGCPLQCEESSISRDTLSISLGLGHSFSGLLLHEARAGQGTGHPPPKILLLLHCPSPSHLPLFRPGPEGGLRRSLPKKQRSQAHHLWSGTLCALPHPLTLCLLVSLSACLSACLSLCLSLCLPVCLSAHLYACLPVSLPVYLSLSVCLHVSLSVSLPVYLSLSVCLSVYLSACLSLYLPVSFSACLSLSVCLSVLLPACLSAPLPVCLLILQLLSHACLASDLSVDNIRLRAQDGDCAVVKLFWVWGPAESLRFRGGKGL